MVISGWQGATDEDDRRGRRAIRRVQLISGVGAVVILGLGTFLTSASAIPSPYSGGPPSPWREDASGVGISVAVLLLLLGAVVAWRAGMRPFRHPAAIWSLRRGQYRRAARSVRCGVAVPDGERAVTTVVARSMSRQVKGLLLFAGITVNLAAQALQMTNVWWAALTWLGVVVGVAGMVYVRRDGRPADRWLHVHPYEATSEVANP